MIVRQHRLGVLAGMDGSRGFPRNQDRCSGRYDGASASTPRDRPALPYEVRDPHGQRGRSHRLRWVFERVGCWMASAITKDSLCTGRGSQRFGSTMASRGSRSSNVTGRKTNQFRVGGCTTCPKRPRRTFSSVFHPIRSRSSRSQIRSKQATRSTSETSAASLKLLRLRVEQGSAS